MKTISSQRFLDESIIEEKINNEDYEVTVSPAFEFDGEAYRVVLDGHHSLAAAKKAGIEPEFTEDDGEMAHVLETSGIDDFLYVTYIDSPWYDIETGKEVF